MCACGPERDAARQALHIDQEQEDEADLSSFRRENARVSGATGAGSMSRSLERDLERDVRRRQERLKDAKRLLVQAKTRQQKIEARLSELRSGGGGSGARSTVNRGRALPSVDEELERLKKQMGQG